MATRAYKQETLVLQDDKEVTVKPLPIAPLRRFMESWDKMTDLKEGEDGFGVFINCCGIALEREFKNNGEFDVKPSKDEVAEGEVLSGEYKEYLENVLDIDTIYIILDVAAGIKLNDPKLMEAAMEAASQNT